MEFIKHLLIIAAVIIVFAFLLFPKRDFTGQFIEEADALRDAIKEEEVFDRQAWEKAIRGFIQTYKDRIEDELYKKKLDEIETTFNNRAVKKV